MEDPQAQTNRIEMEGTGIGEIDETRILLRARDIARLDGRSEPGDHDITQAREDLLGAEDEEPDGVEALPEEERPGNGEPPLDAGRMGARLEPQDEQSVPEKLVREGVEEADWNTRANAVEDE